MCQSVALNACLPSPRVRRPTGWMSLLVWSPLIHIYTHKHKLISHSNNFCNIYTVINTTVKNTVFVYKIQGSVTFKSNFQKVSKLRSWFSIYLLFIVQFIFMFKFWKLIPTLLCSDTKNILHKNIFWIKHGTEGKLWLIINIAGFLGKISVFLTHSKLLWSNWRWVASITYII